MSGLIIGDSCDLLGCGVGVVLLSVLTEGSDGVLNCSDSGNGKIGAVFLDSVERSG